MPLKLMEKKKESEPVEITHSLPTEDKEGQRQIGLCLYCGKRGHFWSTLCSETRENVTPMIEKQSSPSCYHGALRLITFQCLLTLWQHFKALDNTELGWGRVIEHTVSPPDVHRCLAHRNSIIYDNQITSESSSIGLSLATNPSSTGKKLRSLSEDHTVLKPTSLSLVALLGLTACKWITRWKSPNHTFIYQLCSVKQRLQNYHHITQGNVPYGLFNASLVF